jgi:hypothetical protein
VASISQEIVDAFHEAFESLELNRPGQLAVGVQFMARRDVRFCVRRGQDHRWNPFRCLVIPDAATHFAALHTGKAQVLQDQRGTRRAGYTDMSRRRFVFGRERGQPFSGCRRYLSIASARQAILALGANGRDRNRRPVNPARFVLIEAALERGFDKRSGCRNTIHNPGTE